MYLLYRLSSYESLTKKKKKFLRILQNMSENKLILYLVDINIFRNIVYFFKNISNNLNLKINP